MVGDTVTGDVLRFSQPDPGGAQARRLSAPAANCPLASP